MIVVADTTPLNYLVLLNRIDTLQYLYGKVLAPLAVQREMQHPRAPARVRDFAFKAPVWLEWVPVSRIDQSLPSGLDAGEREAISLAIEHSADLILADDFEARQAAMSQHLVVTGTLAVLAQTALRENADLELMLSELQGLGFRASHATLQTIREEYAERKRLR